MFQIRYEHHPDVVQRWLTNERFVLYVDGLIDNTIVSTILLHRNEPLSEPLPHLPIDRELDSALFSGSLFLYIHKVGWHELKQPKPPGRFPSEPLTEVTLRGPRDGFVEEIGVNLALIRKRLKTASLVVSPFTIGRRSQTTVYLLHMNDITAPEIVADITAQLQQIEIDALTSSNQLEGELNSYSRFFPFFTYTGRPDFVITSLMNGRFAILADGSPIALIGPVTLSLLMNTSEDNHNIPLFVAFERLLRFTGLFIAIFLPAFWVALATFHQDQLPYTLLSNVVLARQGVPFPIALEMLMILLLFELFREAGVRLPSAISQTISVVGGLIIGQAAISAGLTSPVVVVLAAITLVSTYTLVNQSLANIVSLLRFVILITSSFLGLFGFFLTLFVLVAYLSQLHSFRLPYLDPFAPLRWKEVWKIAWPLSFHQSQRTSALHVKDDDPR